MWKEVTSDHSPINAGLCKTALNSSSPVLSHTGEGRRLTPTALPAAGFAFACTTSGSAI